MYTLAIQKKLKVSKQCKFCMQRAHQKHTFYKCDISLKILNNTNTIYEEICCSRRWMDLKLQEVVVDLN